MPCCSSFLSAVSFFFFFFFFHLPRSILSKERDPYYGCHQEFKCGPIKNISYPFFAYSQPDYCGRPSFRLKCENNVTRIIINGQRYSVLDIEPDTQTVKIARNGWKRYWMGNCPTQGYNTSLNYVTLSLSAPFHLSSSPTSNLTFFYNCPLPKTLPTKFQCDTSVTPKDAWISTDANTSHVQPELLKCHDRIAVPLIGTTILDLIHLNSTIEDILKVSFKVKYSVSIWECNECRRSEGQCGYNQTTRKPTCFCGGRVYGLTCPPKGSNTMRNVGIGVGAGAGVLLLACVFFLIRLRRKKHQSKSSALFSRSLTPDSSTKPDLERGTSSYFQTPIFSYAELQEATDNFDSSKEIGDGGFGTVYHGTLRDGRVVAVKRLYENNYKRHDQFMNELEILSRLRHRNLVTLYGCTTRHSRELLLVYEYIPNGTVADNLHGDRASTSPLTWPVRLSVAIETADALSYLHASDIIHRDVKTTNILLDHNFHVKVADFGLSRLFPINATHVSTAPQGTPGYVDPEYYQCYQLNDKSDVYSFGVVLIELISSKPAVDIGRHRHEINLSNMAINKIHNDALHELVDPSLGFESDYSVRRMITMVAELAFRCLQQEKDMRPGMMEVLKCLKDIESAEKVEKAEEVDIPADARLLKNVPPFSPTSVTDKWVSSTTTPNTSG